MKPDEGNNYSIHATFDVDSTVVLDHMVLYADGHASLSSDSLFLTPEHTFTVERRALGLDELYLCSDGGELSRFYVMGGMDVSLHISGTRDSLVVQFEPTETDSINPWLQQQRTAVSQCGEKERSALMDSLCHQMSADVRCALLLREEVESLSDSVFVRRCLGALSAEAKPEWLVKGIDDLLLVNASYLTRSNRRLPAGKFQVNDSTVFDMGASRSDYLLIYCWADYDSTSMDSLKTLVKLIDDDYYMKRLKLFTCCLGAADSAAWQAVVKDVEGTHVWLPAGVADQRVRNWDLLRVPSVMVCDMYNNQQCRNVWGKELRNALSRIPNRSGFAHTPKTKPHGR